MTDRTALILSDDFLRHETGDHPESPSRLIAIRQGLQQAGMLADRPVWEPQPASLELVTAIHRPEYVSMVERLALLGGGWLDADTVVCPVSYPVALLAAGAAVQAVDAVMAGQAPRVFAFVRPPGHHAEPGRGMGFCLFNNIAIAAWHALHAYRLQRVAILDWDVHHGNGTQAAFYDTDRVLFISLHQWPLYPGTGRASETGRGEGLGFTLNLPLLPGTGDARYLALFDETIEPRLLDYRPELLLVSAGYDAHWQDPLADMRVTEQGFAAMAARVRRWADTLCAGRLVLVLEGGYNLAALAASVVATLQALDEPNSIG
ncbi:histone deacetylase [Thermorudis peleae]|uniref:histone deacetylase family protein n=1 Tax=Thermorudis peleae TaxID=1382356 RepID=UPI00056DEA1A|nr:histone deacetylase [Thermorudis peleae]